MSYTPLHERPPHYTSLPTPPGNVNRSPRYASPVSSPSIPWPDYQNMSSSQDEEEYDAGPSHEEEHHSSYDEVDQAGPSRKRQRGESNGHPHHPSHRPSQRNLSDMPIIPSIFGIAPRNEFTKKVGEWIMECTRGREHVEIEIKLGTLHSPAGPQRIKLPTRTEIILQPDYPVGNFASTMHKRMNQNLNGLLNSAFQSSQQSPAPIKFFREQHSDSFYGGQRGHKLRVSRDRAGNLLPGGCIVKHRIGDLNVHSPNELFDWRVSVSTEEPFPEVPSGQPLHVREKDRACYQHQFCRIDLTVVTMRQENGPPQLSYELEIEVLDVPLLLAEGEKEARGESNRFDDILQSILDTVRMIIRNVE
ncbi:CYTH-like domain-containing protein [Kockovaella imperatae]|uniref:mRNA-capping enzyme subunit beta n=1 Tax=Kockovaella imperatae TaxID=4999 RepID=A0A1Y1U7M9_9TREE|nr:CYTH-like domain-containing protein [Kockovaella imperatae]ORX33526.1 CYTH-like domain-containing protein [Kockovaella imperatae]